MVLKELILYFKQKKNVVYEDFINYLEDIYKPGKAPLPEVKDILIPVAVFDNDYLSALESIVKYLYENKGLRLSEIAKLLSRDSRAIGVTYKFARKKMKSELKVSVSKQSFPASALAERKLSVLESIVYYLKKQYYLSFHDIALLLKRDDRTIWTVYQRALKKL
ncbi:MAG: hypothetical protein KKF46_02675 [Nanoarchaeota archaeon]|nr:hypothetical protein [Nanoarchaeota archaeon]MBU1321236.1 hypothetical protein [Nanoarchaeota archaeon]MBU1596990.1 hypothetical protein [Nanoarchaeota archaeon]MBU2441569.1 hypothetical protein [Nanoarchaeota archaeon]